MSGRYATEQSFLNGGNNISEAGTRIVKEIVFSRVKAGGDVPFRN